MQQTSHSCTLYMCMFIVKTPLSAIPALESGNIRIRPRINGRELPDRKNHDSSFITSMDVSGYTAFQMSCCSPSWSRSYIKQCRQDMLWRKLLWASLELSVVIEQTIKVADYLNITEDKLHPYMLSVFPNGDGVFEQNNYPCHRTGVVPETLY